MAGTTEPPDQDPRQAASNPGGDTDFPASNPDEIQPQQEPPDSPGQAPDEFVPGEGDRDQPDDSPVETPPPEPTPAAPD